MILLICSGGYVAVFFSDSSRQSVIELAACIVETVELIDPTTVASAVSTMLKLILLTSMLSDADEETDIDFASPPSSTKRCRTLDVHPSDESLC